jgi:hypothetical protein
MQKHVVLKNALLLTVVALVLTMITTYTIFSNFKESCPNARQKLSQNLLLPIPTQNESFLVKFFLPCHDIYDPINNKEVVEVVSLVAGIAIINSIVASAVIVIVKN